MAGPLLRLHEVWREHGLGDGRVVALRQLSLDIQAGEMVAIMGPSGSGKSTLMHILGCLDRPTQGRYEIEGRDLSLLSADELADLRRHRFGFVFQRYHLLEHLNALRNVEMPAVYAGGTSTQRLQQADAWLQRLGLGERLQRKPSQLSGGQQQRVSIARALVNGASVILADEPTGALDSHNGAQVMAILQALHRQGRTVIVVTHDEAVARHAQRVIELRDGEVVADRLQDAVQAQGTAALGACELSSDASAQGHVAKGGWASAQASRLLSALEMAARAMNGHRLRTVLTMLGIVIGIASVVTTVALGAGSRAQVLADISAMGTNTIDVFPGKNFGDRQASRIQTLVPTDATALAALPYVDSVTPSVATSVTVRHGGVEDTANVTGAGEQFFRVHGYELAAGQAFDADGVRRQAQDAVIDPNAKRALFHADEDPLGQVILLGQVPLRVVGVTAEPRSGFLMSDNLNVWVPYTTAMHRILGQPYLRNITVRVQEGANTQAAEQGITRLLRQRHGSEDFFVRNSDSIRQTIEETTQTLTLLVSSIAVIALVVGGIGVMNIMLVSVAERTQEIGVRMAVGARRGDILRQFLIESVFVCVLGGILGAVLARTIGLVFEKMSDDFQLLYSTASYVMAFAVSTAVGLLFGYLPARRASQLDPVQALSGQ